MFSATKNNPSITPMIHERCEFKIKSKQTVQATSNKRIPTELTTSAEAVAMSKTKTNAESINHSNSHIRLPSNVPGNFSQIITIAPIATPLEIDHIEKNVVSTSLKLQPKSTIKLATSIVQLASPKTKTIPFTDQQLPQLSPKPQTPNPMHKRKLILPPITNTKKKNSYVAKTSRLNTTNHISSASDIDTSAKKVILRVRSTHSPGVVSNCSTFNTIDTDVMPPLPLLATPPHQSSAFSNNEMGITMQNKNKTNYKGPNTATNMIDVLDDQTLKTKQNLLVKQEKSTCEKYKVYAKNKPILVSAHRSINLTKSPDRTCATHDNIKVALAESIVTCDVKPNLNLKTLTEADSRDCINNEHQTPEYVELLSVLRKADSSPDMERLIEKKLNKYYTAVSYSSFIKSRGFRKNMRSVIDMINRDPDLVYFHLKSVLEELKSRYHSRPSQCDDNSSENNSNKVDSVKEESAQITSSDELSQRDNNSTKSSVYRSKQMNLQIQKLNAALHVLTQNIEKLEQSEVDFDDEDSSYLQVERLKKRACQIYNKICDLTGENKNAHRLIKKTIQFNGTQFPQFNKTLRAFLNRTKEFPDYYDVLHMVEHCNRRYEFGLANFQIKRLAEDAFIQVGKLLQARRKTDLYETVSHYTANASDPAKNDPLLLAKLNENKQVQKRIGDVIAKFAREQERVLDEQKSMRINSEYQNSKDLKSNITDGFEYDKSLSSGEINDEEDFNKKPEFDSPKNGMSVKNTDIHQEIKQYDGNRINGPSEQYNNETEGQNSTYLHSENSKLSRLSKCLGAKSYETKSEKVRNTSKELKISSVYSLGSNKPAMPISIRKTPRSKTTSCCVKTNALSNNETISEKSSRPLMEIWISDDEDDLLKERTMLKKSN